MPSITPAKPLMVAVCVGALLIAAPVEAGAAKHKRSKPDLSVTSVRLPGAAYVGTPFTVGVRVKNKGRARAGKSVMRFFLSSDDRRGGSDTRLRGHWIGSLKAKHSSHRFFALTAPTAARVFVIACADATAKLREKRENNNCRASSKLEIARRKYDDGPLPGGGCGLEVALTNVNATGYGETFFSIAGEADLKDLPVAGDWNNDGNDTVTLFRPSDQAWLVRNSNTNGQPDVTFQFGPAGALPVAGDWDGDGIDTVGYYEPATGVFGLRNSLSAGTPEIVATMAAPLGLTPLAGDWNGDGIDTIGGRSGATFMLRNTNSSGTPDLSFDFGPAVDSRPIAGDWDGNGTDTVGFVRFTAPTHNLRNLNTAGSPDLAFTFGGGTPIAGDWNNDSIDTVGAVGGICAAA